MQHRRSRARRSKTNLFWERFDPVRTKQTRGDIKGLQNTLVSLTMPATSTHRDLLEAIARELQPPLAIESLPELLGKNPFPRGKTIFRLSAGDAIDNIAANYEDVCWWVSKHGLNMATVPPVAMTLSQFDELAGRLYVEGSKDGKLSKELLFSIAKQLDRAGFQLLNELQPAQRAIIISYNQRNSRKAVKTFVAACTHSTLVRAIKQRLYVARDRYRRASPASID